MPSENETHHGRPSTTRAVRHHPVVVLLCLVQTIPQLHERLERLAGNRISEYDLSVPDRSAPESLQHPCRALHRLSIPPLWESQLALVLP